MKAIRYETSPGATATYLGSGPVLAGAFFDLYTFSLVGSINGGSPLYYTTCDVNIKVPYVNGATVIPGRVTATGPITYSSKLSYFDQLENKAYGHWKVGLDVDTWQVITAPTPQATIGSQGWLSAVRAGALDGAVVGVDRAYFDNRASGLPQGATSISPLGVVNIFTGRVDVVNFGRSNAVISINSHLQLLDVNMPRNLYQGICRWPLYSPGCALIQSDFGVNGTVAAATNSVTLTSSVGAPSGSGTYALGSILMTSGANTGYSRSVRSWTAGSPGTFTLMSPFPFNVAMGDAFTAYPGCDRLLSTCIAFDNVENYSAMPFIPAPETAV